MCVLFFSSILTSAFQASVLDSTAVSTCWHAHLHLGALRGMPCCLDYYAVQGILIRCHTKTFRCDYSYHCCAIMTFHLHYLVFIHFLGYYNTTALSAVLSSLVLRFSHGTNIVYVDYSTAELIRLRNISLRDTPTVRTSETNWWSSGIRIWNLGNRDPNWSFPQDGHLTKLRASGLPVASTTESHTVRELSCINAAGTSLSIVLSVA